MKKSNKILCLKILLSFNESDETTHFSIIDKWGNIVSNTYTLNTAYTRIIPKGTGILMNNEMDDFLQNQSPEYIWFGCPRLTN